jgi:hypothetical protein
MLMLALVIVALLTVVVRLFTFREPDPWRGPDHRCDPWCNHVREQDNEQEEFR